MAVGDVSDKAARAVIVLAAVFRLWRSVVCRHIPHCARAHNYDVAAAKENRQSSLPDQRTRFWVVLGRFELDVWLQRKRRRTRRNRDEDIISVFLHDGETWYELYRTVRGAPKSNELWLSKRFRLLYQYTYTHVSQARHGLTQNGIQDSTYKIFEKTRYKAVVCRETVVDKSALSSA